MVKREDAVVKRDGVVLDPKRINRARDAGCLRPVTAFIEARKAGIAFYILCAFLEQESSGGLNVFGHDNTIFAGAGKVTKSKYLAYLKERDAIPGQRRMQGVGPLQLTWYEFQDGADELGGCWKPRINIRYGATLLANYRKSLGSWFDAAERYNGSREYAVRNEELREKWRKVIEG